MINPLVLFLGNILKKPFKAIFAFLIMVFLYLATLWRLWITKDLMFVHDSFHWYGAFYYLANSLAKGFFPFWNPYMNCGEPFFLSANISRLTDPSTFILIFISNLLKINFVSLYHYHILLFYLIFIGGCYLFFQYIAKHKISAFIAFVSVAFSSLGISYLRQQGFILNMYLLPWILLCGLKLWEEKRPIYLIGSAFFLGILFPTYSAMYILSFSLILFVSLFISKGLPRLRWSIFSNNYKITLLAILILLLLGFKIAPLALMAQDIVPTVRMHEVAHSAYSHPRDFLLLLTPYHFTWYFFILKSSMSESFLYIGLMPLLLLMVGLFFSRQRYKLGFLITTIFIALLALGDRTFIYPLMRKFFPFFSFIRNMHSFGAFFIFCLGYFVCIGADVIFDRVYTFDEKGYGRRFNLSFILFIILIVAGVGLSIFHFSNAAGNIKIPPVNIRFFTFLMQSSKIYAMRNTLLFITGGAAIFFFLIKRRKKILNVIGSVLLISFILIDLGFFSRALYQHVTQPRPDDDFGLPVFATETTYKNFRIPKATLNFPFSAAMFKQFTAYHDFNECGSHFYEMSDYYEFRTSPIPSNIKNIWMGISSSKLRLVPKCIIGSERYITSRAASIGPRVARNSVFINDDLPERYAHLKTTIEEVSKERLNSGKIKVENFNSNQITLDVYSQQDAFLYYSDGFDKSWRVFIDGEEDKVYKANLAFKAVIVPQGRHRVRFLYDPKLYTFSLFSYFVGLLGTVVICIAIRKREK